MPVRSRRQAMRVPGDWLLTAERAAVHLPTATAVVADLHLGYGEARRAAGEAVPVLPVEQALAPLGRLLARGPARRLVLAGDLFEAGASEALVAELLAWVGRQEVELSAVVPGNHDRQIDHHAGRLPLRPDGVDLGGWRVVHGDGEWPAGRAVQGHVHPCVRWGRLSAPCFLVSADRVVLPAFSADARGANVLREPCWSAYRCCAVAGGEVLDLGEVAGLRGRVPE